MCNVDYDTILGFGASSTASTNNIRLLKDKLRTMQRDYTPKADINYTILGDPYSHVSFDEYIEEGRIV